MNDPVLELRDLDVEYRSDDDEVNQVVTQASFDIQPGEVVGLVGKSGAGKSTLGLALLGLVRPPGRITGGEVIYRGRSLLSLREKDLREVRGRRIGLVTQNPRAALNPMHAIGRQIVDAYRAHHPRASKSEAMEKAIELLRLLGINDPGRRIGAYPHELSGGMAQRALLAIAMVCQPDLLVADEPTSGLDVTVQAQVLDDMSYTARNTGSSVLLITKDLGVVANFCSRVLVMSGGAIVESAATRQLFTNPQHEATRELLEGQRATRDGAEVIEKVSHV